LSPIFVEYLWEMKSQKIKLWDDSWILLDNNSYFVEGTDDIIDVSVLNIDLLNDLNIQSFIRFLIIKWFPINFFGITAKWFQSEYYDYSSNIEKTLLKIISEFTEGLIIEAWAIDEILAKMWELSLHFSHKIQLNENWELTLKSKLDVIEFLLWKDISFNLKIVVNKLRRSLELLKSWTKTQILETIA
jgi:hypothetical protein